MDPILEARDSARGNNLDASDIIVPVVAEARRRGLRVVAEGVETLDQLDFIRSMGCERAQGFLLSRPIDKDAVARPRSAVNPLKGLRPRDAGAAMAGSGLDG